MRLNFFLCGLMMCAAGLVTQPGAGDCTIQSNTLMQRMSGFGGSTAWAGSLSDNLINELFSATAGCGLTLVRMRISPEGTTGSGEIAIAKKAQALGAFIWAAPWSPPATWKDPSDVNNGGILLTSHYQDWADRLVSYVKSMNSQGIDLKWISAQNEPNWTATYESCLYTPDQLVSFIGTYLGPSLEKAGLKTRIIAPEVINWGSLKPYADAILNSAAALKYCDVIATHSYGDGPKSPNFPYKLIAEKGKQLWETEYGFDQYAGDETMTPGIAIAKQMHTQIVQGPASAYHTWWIIPAGGVNGTASNGLVMGGHVIQRGYVMGNYSRFVRPGSYRVSTNDNPSSGVWVTAYRNDSLGHLSVIAINENTSAVQQTFLLNGITVPNVIPWETSEAVKLTARPQVTAGSNFSWSLPAKSVVSFIGTYSVATARSGQSAAAYKTNRNIRLDRNLLIATVHDNARFTITVYTLHGATIGSYNGTGPGTYRVHLRANASEAYLVGFSTQGHCSYEKLVSR